MSRLPDAAPSTRPAGAAGDLAGAVADLGTFVPLAAGLILVNGLEAGAVLLMAGALVIASGLWFGIPWPVQPLKALSATAIALGLDSATIHAAGLELGLLLLVLSIPVVMRGVMRIFTLPVIRCLQVGVGVLLMAAAVRLVAHPPEVFRGEPVAPWPVVLAIGALAVVVWATATRRYWVLLLLVGLGTTATVVAGPGALPSLSVTIPELALPEPGAFAGAFFLLVVAQVPLTLGNAVVAVGATARDHFGARAERATPSRICLSAATANVCSALLGGMPMCHGAGGLTAHVRMGARSARMNVYLGVAFVSLGLFFAPSIPTLLGSLPVWALAAFLAYAGLRHALLVRDQRGIALAIALTTGLAGAALGNLALGAAAAVLLDRGPRLVRRLLPEPTG